MGFYKITRRFGKSKRAKEWQGAAPAQTRVAIRRYHCGMTVGSGWYRHYIYTNSIGASCAVLGWFDDGRVSVELPGGGCGLLGRADVDIVSWPDFVPIERRDEWDRLPMVSRVQGEEIQGLA